MVFRPFAALLSRLPAAAVCALGAHALLYGTLRPADGLHGYFGWYEPAVAVLSLASLAGLLALLAFAVATRRSPIRGRARPFDERVRALSVSALVFLLAQETLEHSLRAGHPVLVTFAPSGWLVLLAGIAATSLMVAAALHFGHAVVVRAVRGRPTSRPRAIEGWSVVTSVARRLRPLAERFALRGPPLPQS